MRGGTGAKALADIRGRIADTNPEDPLLDPGLASAMREKGTSVLEETVWQVLRADLPAWLSA